jgi:hypothetical protein
VTHGNRLVSKLVFDAVPKTKFRDPGFDFAGVVSAAFIEGIVDQKVEVLKTLLDKHYPNAIISTLFKNLKRCEHLATESLNASLPNASVASQGNAGP